MKTVRLMMLPGERWSIEEKGPLRWVPWDASFDTEQAAIDEIVAIEKSQGVKFSIVSSPWFFRIVTRIDGATCFEKWVPFTGWHMPCNTIGWMRHGPLNGDFEAPHRAKQAFDEFAVARPDFVLIEDAPPAADVVLADLPEVLAGETPETVATVMDQSWRIVPVFAVERYQAGEWRRRNHFVPDTFATEADAEAAILEFGAATYQSVTLIRGDGAEIVTASPGCTFPRQVIDKTDLDGDASRVRLDALAAFILRIRGDSGLKHLITLHSVLDEMHAIATGKTPISEIEVPSAGIDLRHAFDAVTPAPVPGYSPPKYRVRRDGIRVAIDEPVPTMLMTPPGVPGDGPRRHINTVSLGEAYAPKNDGTYRIKPGCAAAARVGLSAPHWVIWRWYDDRKTWLPVQRRQPFETYWQAVDWINDEARELGRVSDLVVPSDDDIARWSKAGMSIADPVTMPASAHHSTPISKQLTGADLLAAIADDARDALGVSTPTPEIGTKIAIPIDGEFWAIDEWTATGWNRVDDDLTWDEVETKLRPDRPAPAGVSVGDCKIEPRAGADTFDVFQWKGKAWGIIAGDVSRRTAEGVVTARANDPENRKAKYEPTPAAGAVKQWRKLMREVRAKLNTIEEISDDGDIVAIRVNQLAREALDLFADAEAGKL
jgi:hypothetical protein